MSPASDPGRGPIEARTARGRRRAGSSPGTRRAAAGWVRSGGAALVVAGGAVIGMSVSAYGTSPSSAPHVMVVMMENKNLTDVIGQADQPFTNGLATDGGLATQSYSMVTGSLPNYLALVSGSTQGDTDTPPSTEEFPNTPTVADQLTAAGFTAKAYAEDLPADPSNNSGAYEVTHLPWEYFPSTQIPIADSTSLISDLNSASAPDFVWFSPTDIDDEDAGTVADGDAFLAGLIPAVQATSWYKAGGQIIIEWDESTNDKSGINGTVGGGKIPTIVVSAALAANPEQDSAPVDTVGLLHSIEDLYGLPHLGGSDADGTIDSLLSATSPTTTTTAPTTTTTVLATSATLASTTTTTSTAVLATSATLASTTTTTSTAVTATTQAPRPGTTAEHASGGAIDPPAVSASSTDLAFTGPGRGLDTLLVVGGCLVLCGFALLSLVGMPRRRVARPALVDTSGRRVDTDADHRSMPETASGDLWLRPPT